MNLNGFALFARGLISSSYWKNGFSVPRAIRAALAASAAFWLIAEIVWYCFPEFEASSGKPLVLALLALVAAGYAFWENRPKHSTSCRVSNRDVTIRIVVADIFSISGSMIVGTNTTFDTDISGLIDRKSIQGKFTETYFANAQQLDRELDHALAGVTYENAHPGKRGKKNVYPIGTTVRVDTPKRTAYFVAIAQMGMTGAAAGTFDDIRTALPALWDFIQNNGTIDSIVVPVLGSGFSRVPESRETIVREMIMSFIASCSVRRFAESLTIAISPNDFYKYSIDMEELSRFLAHVCKYTEFTSRHPGFAVNAPGSAVAE